MRSVVDAFCSLLRCRRKDEMRMNLEFKVFCQLHLLNCNSCLLISVLLLTYVWRGGEWLSPRQNLQLSYQQRLEGCWDGSWLVRDENRISSDNMFCKTDWWKRREIEAKQMDEWLQLLTRRRRWCYLMKNDTLRLWWSQITRDASLICSRQNVMNVFLNISSQRLDLIMYLYPHWVLLQHFVIRGILNNDCTSSSSVVDFYSVFWLDFGTQ